MSARISSTSGEARIIGIVPDREAVKLLEQSGSMSRSIGPRSPQPIRLFQRLSDVGAVIGEFHSSERDGGGAPSPFSRASN
jgi:hypothetical protein